MINNKYTQHFRRKVLPLLIQLYFAIFFISCGDADKSNAGEENINFDNSDLNINACDFLTKADVEEILGEEVNEGNEEMHTEGTANTAAMSQCSYNSKTSNKNISLMLRKSPVPDRRAGQSVKETLKESDIPVQDVNDLGVTAFWSDPQLHIFNDENLYMIISVRGFESEVSLEKSKSIAKKILKSL